MNNAELIVAVLKAAGINHGFGIPSGNVLPLMEAMREGGVEFVLTAHEGSAAFCADATASRTQSSAMTNLYICASIPPPAIDVAAPVHRQLALSPVHTNVRGPLPRTLISTFIP